MVSAIVLMHIERDKINAVAEQLAEIEALEPAVDVGDAPARAPAISGEGYS